MEISRGKEPETFETSHQTHFWPCFEISVEQRGINPILLANNIARIFENGNVTKMACLIDAISKSDHGSIIVISEGAQAESKRLRVNGFLPAIFEPHHALLNQLSKIDGAVMLDPALRATVLG